MWLQSASASSSSFGSADTGATLVAALHGLLDGWHAEPVPLALAGAALAVYWRARTAPGDEHHAPAGLRDVAYVAGIGVVLVALLSPIDQLALGYQWVHMVQHLLLLVVAPPIVLLAHPVQAVRQLISAHRNGAIAGVSTGRRGRAPATVAVTFSVLFVGVLWLWHIPALYNATLANAAVHDLEHTALLITGLLFWGAVIGSKGMNIGLWSRSAMALAGMFGGWALAIVIGYAPAVLYAYPGDGALSALTDQQIASGVMWVPGSSPFVLALIILVARWFEEDSRDPSAAGAPLPGRAS